MKRPFASVAIPASSIDAKTRARFLAKIDAIDTSACWEWRASRTRQGYGRFLVNGQCTTAQRVAYAVFIGDLPAGLTIDHLCRNRGCMNPAHIEAVPHRVNVLRSPDNIAVKHGAKERCPRGHDFAVVHTTLHGKPFSQRYCPECKRTNGREWQRRRRAALRAERQAA